MKFNDTYLKYNSFITEEIFNEIITKIESWGYRGSGSNNSYDQFTDEYPLLKLHNENWWIFDDINIKSYEEITVDDILGKKEADGWCVVVSEENRDIVRKWLKDTCPKWESNSLKISSKYGINDEDRHFYIGTNLYIVPLGSTYSRVLTTQEFYDKIGHKVDKPKQEFKVGEYYYQFQNIDGNNGEFIHKIGFVGKLGSIDSSKTYSTDWLCFDGVGNGCSAINFRPATSEEIAKVTGEVKSFEPDKDVILEECKRRYPLGVKVKSLAIGKNICEVKSFSHDGSNSKEIWFIGTPVDIKVYDKGEYAETISESKPESKEFKGEEPLERARREYPIGTKYYAAHLNKDNSIICTVSDSNSFEFADGDIIESYGNKSKNGHIYNETIYSDEGKWAEKVSEPVRKYPYNIVNIPIEYMDSFLHTSGDSQKSLILKEEILPIETRKKRKKKRSSNITLIN